MPYDKKTPISRPFLKWAGGKGQLVEAIDRRYPFKDGGIKKYVEPFVGGGAVLFDVLAKFSPEKIYINDINHELINTYLTIRDHPESLIDLLLGYENAFLPLDNEARKNYYSQKRARFNELKMVSQHEFNRGHKDNSQKDKPDSPGKPHRNTDRDNIESSVQDRGGNMAGPGSTEQAMKFAPACMTETKRHNLRIADQANIEKAALMIFLNRTCFNGLFRVNKKGLFNVPMGSYKRPAICDAENLRLVSKSLQKVMILCGDYWRLGAYIDETTFLYLDPPYRPLNGTSSFTAYAENCFDDLEQERLAQFVAAMREKGAKILLSNSDPKNYDQNDNFFENLYASYNIDRVEATRMINCKSAGRGKITELMISN